MFHRYGKGKGVHAKPLKDLIPVIPPAQLLAEEKRSSLLTQIKEIIALEDSRYESLCLTLIHSFVNHCQSLPETLNSYYSQLGGLLDHALNRTEAALSLFRQYLVYDEKTGLSEEQKLWQYALFSAAILQGIGKLQIDFTVDLYDNNGNPLKQWNPLLESLAAVGSYYDYEFLKESDIEFRRRLNLLIARFLMPASGFAWIASNQEVLAIWLALLNEDPYAAGTLGAILIRADAIALQRYFNQLAIRNYGSRGGRFRRPSTFAGGVPESVNELEQQIGVDFIQWLNKKLALGRIMINQSPLFIVPGGMLMLPDIFKLFVREHPEFKNWQAIQNGFLALNLHRRNPKGESAFRFEDAKHREMYEGVVFAEYGIALPDELQVNDMNNDKAVAMTATEVIHAAPGLAITQMGGQKPAALSQLDAAGSWQEVTHFISKLQPGTHGG